MNKSILKIVLLIIIICLSGCGGVSKSDLEFENNQLNAEISTLKTEVDKLNSTLKALSSDGSVKPAVSNINAKSDKQTFNKLADKVVFTTPLEYPDSSQAPNNAKFSLSNNVSVTPTNNWLMVSDGTSLEMNHPAGIHGVIRVVKIQKQLKNELLEERLQEFIKQFPKDSSISYGDIFLDNYCSGKYADTMTTVDGKKAIIRVGMVGAANTGALYAFYYDGEQDKIKDELIDNIIKSIDINGLKVKFE